MDIVESIANLINEDPDDVRSLRTPSQVFSQVFYRDPTAGQLSLEAALKRVIDYGQQAGMNDSGIQAALEYTKRVWPHFADPSASEAPRTVLPPEQGFDPDQHSSRGY